MPPTVLSDRSLESKVRQLFIVGFDGTTPTGAVTELVETGVGGVIYFARNIDTPEQVSACSRTLQRAADQNDHSPLFITVDEEGGLVSRLPWTGRLPSQMAMGAGEDSGLVRRAAAATARELRSIGINVNFSPVLDVNNNPDNPVIGTRSFGEHPERVSDLGVAVARGYEDEGVVACGKHFPGHGDTATDSHLDLPVVGHDRDRINAVELAPFRAAIDTGIGAIMTTHVSFPAFTDDEERPATLSESVLTGLLREELGYKGLIVSDCLEMNAIADTYGTVEGAVQAVAAGCDLVTISHTAETQRAAIDAVVDAVRSGSIPESRVDASVRRIRRTKQWFAACSPTHDDALWEEANTQRRRLARRLAESGCTVVRNRDDVLPIRGDTIHVISSGAGRGSTVESTADDLGVFVDRLRDHDRHVELYALDSAGQFGDSIRDGEPVVVCTRDARSNPTQAALVQRVVERASSAVVLATRTPYDLTVVPDVSTYVTTYDEATVSLSVAADVVVGAHDATGSLPVTVPGS